MATATVINKIDPGFIKRIQKFGNTDWTACYHCGNCTATCSLTNEQELYPRKIIKLTQLGLKDKLATQLEPWMCYYCGDCSSHCPRQASPGELMMSIRRYLTTVYDWTGLSSLLYLSPVLNAFLYVILTIAVIAFASYHSFNITPIMHYGHLFEMWAIASVFILILLPNIIRMWYLSLVKPGHKVPLINYIKHLPSLFVHMFTQKKYILCEDKKLRWLEHLILVFGYILLLITTVFLNWFETTKMWIIVAGYIESAAVFIVTSIFIVERIQKKEEFTRFTHFTDWMFVIWLFLIGITSLIVRIFIDLNIIQYNIWIYLIHMIILVQWALLIVPFGKWTHFLYRSFAAYFMEIKNEKIRS